MKPEARERVPAGVGAALRDLVFVVGKDQVHAPGMEIEHVGAEAAADQLERHGGTFDVPAGPAPAERRVPRRADLLVLFLGRLPEHEVPRVLFGVLVGAHPLARPRLELPAVELRQPAIRGKPRDREIDRSVLALVGHLFVEQPLDHLDHGTDVLGGARLLMGRADPEPVAVFLERPGERVDVGPERHALGEGGRDGAVVHVGEVHDVQDVVAARLEPAAQEILEEERPEVADVGVVVDGGAAGVERHASRLNGRERLYPAGQGVVELERHPCEDAVLASSGADVGDAGEAGTWTVAVLSRRPCGGRTG